MEKIKEFYKNYKINIGLYSLPNKTFIKLYGNEFARFAQKNNLSWESICELIESFGFKHIEKNIK